MIYVSDLIDQGDFCPLILVIAILSAIGVKMTQRHWELHTWGIRIAAVAFVLFAIMDLLRVKSPTAQDLLWALVRALFASALALGPAWIILAICGFLYTNLKRARNQARIRADKRQRKRQAEQQERQAERQEREFERSAPEREQARREAAELHEEELKAAARRENARVACELLYNLYAPDLLDRLPRDAVDDFVAKYMRDGQPIELVEERAAQLQAMIQQHYEQVRRPGKFTDLGQVTRWYEKEKDKIVQLDIDQSFKDDYLVQLNERHAELAQRVLEKLEP